MASAAHANQLALLDDENLPRRIMGSRLMQSFRFMDKK